jgi:uncharacterized protein (DUF305 family)
MPAPFKAARMLVIALAIAAALPAAAQDHSAHAGHGATAPYAVEWDSAMAAMHDGMAVPLTGDADTDFLAGMIPHHQGAIDMARIVLAYGADPEIRKLAESIIAAQEAEIALMRAMLEARGQ